MTSKVSQLRHSLFYECRVIPIAQPSQSVFHAHWDEGTAQLLPESQNNATQATRAEVSGRSAGVFLVTRPVRTAQLSARRYLALPKDASSPRPDPSPSFCARRLPAAKPPVACAERFSAAVLPLAPAGIGVPRRYYRRRSGAEQRPCRFLEPKGPARQWGISGRKGRRNIKRK